MENVNARLMWYLETEIAFPTTSEYTVSKLNMHQKSKLWSLHFGSLGIHQLQTITKHVTGILETIVPHVFAFHNTVQDANITKRAKGHKNHTTTKFGDRFHMDFGFMRALSDKYKRKKT